MEDAIGALAALAATAVSLFWLWGAERESRKKSRRFYAQNPWLTPPPWLERERARERF